MTYAITVYDDFGPKLGLVVRKHLALLGMKSLETRWSCSSKSISEVKGYSEKKKKSRDITLSTKVHLVKAMVFPVVMYGCERWTVKKAESAEELMLLNCGVGEDS